MNLTNLAELFLHEPGLTGAGRRSYGMGVQMWVSFRPTGQVGFEHEETFTVGSSVSGTLGVLACWGVCR